MWNEVSNRSRACCLLHFCWMDVCCLKIPPTRAVTGSEPIWLGDCREAKNCLILTWWDCAQALEALGTFVHMVIEVSWDHRCDAKCALRFPGEFGGQGRGGHRLLRTGSFFYRDRRSHGINSCIWHAMACWHISWWYSVILIYIFQNMPLNIHTCFTRVGLMLSWQACSRKKCDN